MVEDGEEPDKANEDLADIEQGVFTPLDANEEAGSSSVDAVPESEESAGVPNLPRRAPSSDAGSSQSCSLKPCPGEEERDDEIAHKIDEWSGVVTELPSIAESDPAIEADPEPVETIENVFKLGPKRRSSDTPAQTLSTGRASGMRRISSMSEMLRLKGRLRVPALLSQKAPPAGPAVTACSIHVFEPPKLNTGSSRILPEFSDSYLRRYY